MDKPDKRVENARSRMIAEKRAGMPESEGPVRHVQESPERPRDRSSDSRAQLDGKRELSRLSKQGGSEASDKRAGEPLVEKLKAMKASGELKSKESARVKEILDEQHRLGGSQSRPLDSKELLEKKRAARQKNDNDVAE